MSQPVASRPGDPSPGRTHREMPARSMQSRPEISFAVPCLVDFLKGLRSTRHRHPSRRRRSRRRASDPTTTNRPPNRVDHETRVSMWDGSRARLSASSQLDYDFFLVQRSTSGGLRVSMLAQSFDAIASRNFICRTVSRRLPKRSAFNASSPPIPATTVSAPGIGPDHHESTSKPRRPRDASLDVGRVPSEAVCIIATRLRFFSRPALDKWRTPSQHAGAVWISSRHSEQWANSRNKRAEADARKWKTQGRRFASSQNVARRISWLSQSARAVLPSGGRALPLPETRSRWLKRRRVREHNVLHACMRACLRFPTHTPISFSNRHPTPLTFL